MFGVDMNYHPPKCRITWNVEASLIKSAMKHSEPYHGEEKRFASLSRSLYSATGTKTQQQKSLCSQKVEIGRLGMKPNRSHTPKKKQKGKNIIV